MCPRRQQDKNSFHWLSTTIKKVLDISAIWRLYQNDKNRRVYNFPMYAPDFSLPDQNGKIWTLGDFAGQWLLLYFYPKDNTPGCTKEACSFRDLSEEFSKRKICVVGISKDRVVSHEKFAKKYHLNFTLLSDPSHETIAKYDSWGKRKFMGREYDGTFRNSFLISPQGEIIKEYKAVNPLTHAGEILADFDKLTEV